jgi:hypothetical protein
VSRRDALIRGVLAGSLWPNVALIAGAVKTMTREGVHGHKLLLHLKDNMGLHCHPGSTVARERFHHLSHVSPPFLFLARALWQIALRSRYRPWGALLPSAIVPAGCSIPKKYAKSDQF